MRWGLTRWLQALLFGVGPHDTATFAAVSAILLAVAAAACWIPARRASRVDPLAALRTIDPLNGGHTPAVTEGCAAA